MTDYNYKIFEKEEEAKEYANKEIENHLRFVNEQIKHYNEELKKYSKNETRTKNKNRSRLC